MSESDLEKRCKKGMRVRIVVEYVGVNERVTAMSIVGDKLGLEGIGGDVDGWSLRTREKLASNLEATDFPLRLKILWGRNPPIQ